MDSAATGSSDLIFKVVGGPQHDARFPVNSLSFPLDGQSLEAGQVVPVSCMVTRTEQGVHIECRCGVLMINSEPCQSKWLVTGDQIQIGASNFEIEQVGSIANVAFPNTDTVFNEPASQPVKNEATKEHREVSNSNESELCQDAQCEHLPESRSADSMINECSTACGDETGERQSFDQCEPEVPSSVENKGTNGPSLDQLLAALRSVDAEDSALVQDEEFGQTTQALEQAKEIVQTHGTGQLQINELSLESGTEPNDCFSLGCDSEEQQLVELIHTESNQHLQDPVEPTECPVQISQLNASEPEQQIQLPQQQAIDPDKIIELEQSAQLESPELHESREVVAESQPAFVLEPSSYDSERDSGLPAMNETALTRQEDNDHDESSVQETAVPYNETELDGLIDSLTNMAQEAVDETHVATQAATIENMIEDSSDPKAAVPPVSDDSSSSEKLDGLFASLKNQAQEEEAGMQDESPNEVQSNLENSGEPEAAVSSSEDNLGDLFASLRNNEQEEVLEALEETLETLEATPEIEPGRLNELNGVGAEAETAQPGEESSTLNELNLENELSESQIQVDLPVEAEQGLQQTMEGQPDPSCELTCENEQMPMQESLEQNVPQQEGVAEILARMQMMPELTGDSDPTSFAEQQSEQNSEAMEMEPVGSGLEAAAASEIRRIPEPESGGDVQDYMNSLLERLNSDGTATPTVPVAQPQQPVVANQQQASEKHEEAIQEFVPPVEPLKAEDFVPKSVAPEIKSDLAAMRELANTTTRNAVMSSEIRRQKANSHTQLLAAGGGIAGAAVFASLSHGMGDMFFCLAVGCLVVSAACTFFYAKANLLSPNESEGRKAQAGPASEGNTSKTMSKLSRSPEVDN